MNFTDAMNHLFEGKRVARQPWNDYYIMVLPHQAFVWQIGSSNMKAAINAVIYIPSVADIKSDDWFIKVK
jgi:hypothetical protein